MGVHKYFLGSYFLTIFGVITAYLWGEHVHSGAGLVSVFIVMILAILVFAKKVPALLKEIFPSLGGAAAFDYGLSFKKQVVEPLKAAYNTPLGWIPKLGKKTAVGTIGAIDRKIHNLPKPRSAFQQKLDKLTPGRAEVIKNRGEQKDRRSLYEEGRQIYDRYGGEIKFEKKKINNHFE